MFAYVCVCICIHTYMHKYTQSDFSKLIHCPINKATHLYVYISALSSSGKDNPGLWAYSTLMFDLLADPSDGDGDGDGDGDVLLDMSFVFPDIFTAFCPSYVYASGAI